MIMAKKNKRTLRYIRKDLNGSLQKPISSLENIPVSKYYNTIHQLPLRNYIDLTVHSNIYALVISGHPTIEELQIAEDKISRQYAEKMGDAEYKLYRKLFDEINVLTANVNAANVLVDELRSFYVKQFADKLNALFFTSVVFDITNIEDYDAKLNVFHNRIAGIKLNLDLKQINFKAIDDKYRTEGKKPTEDYYVSMLIALSDNAGYAITDQVKTIEFCERIIRAQKKPKQPALRGR